MKVSANSDVLSAKTSYSKVAIFVTAQSVTMLRAERHRKHTFRLLRSVQTDCGAHTAPCSMDTAQFR